MLVLSRKTGEKIVVTVPGGLKILITVVAFREGKVRIGLDAPSDVRIDREEVDERIRNEVPPNADTGPTHGWGYTNPRP